MLLSQSHSNKKDTNLDRDLEKTSLPANPVRETFWTSLSFLPASKLKGRVQRHIWEEPGSISCSFLRGFRKQVATGNDHFHQAPSPGATPSLLPPPPTRLHWDGFMLAPGLDNQPYATLPLKSPDNAIQTGASQFPFVFLSFHILPRSYTGRKEPRDLWQYSQ